MNYINKKIKNIYSEKYRKHSISLSEQHIPKIKEYDCTGGFIMENGTDEIDGENKNYLVIKVYMEQKED